LEYREAEDDNKRAWRCSICAGNSLITLTGVSTSAAVRHLRKKHKISLTQEDEITSQQSSDLASSITEEYDLPVHRSLVHSVNVGKFRYHLLRWVVNSQLAFTAVEDEDFQAMLITLAPSISPYLITGDTVRNWVLDEYLRANEAVKQLLAEAKLRIHISFDLWTLPYQMALCAVIAYFVGP
jgi:hypothetical protein